MPFIQNCAAIDIANGTFYKDPGSNSMLIQIADPGSWFPEPKHAFIEVHKFEFLDVEAGDKVFDEECRISDQQAKEIIDLLDKAMNKDMNVITHCFAGVNRSGAVAEVGVMMGFHDTNSYRSPNLFVKNKLMKVVGFEYDPTKLVA